MAYHTTNGSKNHRIGSFYKEKYLQVINKVLVNLLIVYHPKLFLNNALMFPREFLISYEKTLTKNLKSCVHIFLS